jgi:hypothetical protein
MELGRIGRNRKVSCTEIKSEPPTEAQFSPSPETARFSFRLHEMVIPYSGFKMVEYGGGKERGRTDVNNVEWRWRAPNCCKREAASHHPLSTAFTHTHLSLSTRDPRGILFQRE